MNCALLRAAMLYQFRCVLNALKMIFAPIAKQNHLLVKTYPVME